MTKLEELKTVLDAAEIAWDPADTSDAAVIDAAAAYYVARKNYQDELKKQEGNFK